MGNGYSALFHLLKACEVGNISMVKTLIGRPFSHFFFSVLFALLRFSKLLSQSFFDPDFGISPLIPWPKPFGYPIGTSAAEVARKSGKEDILKYLEAKERERCREGGKQEASARPSSLPLSPSTLLTSSPAPLSPRSTATTCHFSPIPPPLAPTVASPSPVDSPSFSSHLLPRRPHPLLSSSESNSPGVFSTNSADLSKYKKATNSVQLPSNVTLHFPSNFESELKGGKRCGESKPGEETVRSLEDEVVGLYCKLLLSTMSIFAEKISKAKKKSEKKTFQISYELIEDLLVESLPSSLRGRIESHILSTELPPLLSPSRRSLDHSELGDSLYRKLNEGKSRNTASLLHDTPPEIDVTHQLYSQRGD